MSKPLLSSDRKLHAIVLAAGGSRRLGHSKQLLKLGLEPLLIRAVRLAQTVCPGKVTVVIGADHLRMRRLLQQRSTGTSVRYHARWSDGLAGSLQTGIRSLPASAAGALILLIDQPWIHVADLRRLIAAWHIRPRTAAAARYDGRPGAPAIFPRRDFAGLRTLTGDTGARRLLRDLQCITEVPMPSAAFDVDTPEDAARLTAAPVSRN
jgi:molybdenum cofactor cytidylyltransferase